MWTSVSTEKEETKVRLEIRKEPGGKLLGFARLEEGTVVLYGRLQTFEGWVLWDEDVQPISQRDGETWLRALRREFRTPYVHAHMSHDK
jgi:hypothetical protein